MRIDKTACGQDFFTVAEVAKAIRVSERKIWRDIEDKRLRVHRFGGSTRISRQDLDDYIGGSRP